MKTQFFKASYKLLKLLSLTLVLSLILPACGILPKAAQPTETPVPTNTETAIPTATQTATLAPTATATATITPTATSLPTNTPTATPNSTATAEAIATATTKANLAIVQPFLEKYQINPDNGHVAWSDEAPVSLEVDQYNEQYPYPLAINPASDFLFQSDIEWDSTSGLAGCGIIFRADKDLELGEQYKFLLMRLQGEPLWDIEYHNYGRYVTTVTVNGKVQSTGNIRDQRNSENRIAILIQNDQFTVFINGEKLSTGISDKKASGYMALLAWQESGKTSCTFSNNWLWEIDKK